MGHQAALIVAHPDDETVGAGAQLSLWRDVTIIHVTDGAPQNLSDAQRAGFTSRAAYAAARRAELVAALALAGVAESQTRALNVTDQEAVFQLAPLAHRLTELLWELRPAFVLTHPYEGGHPDHDATAFAVAAACQLLARESVAAPLIIEMASYHQREGAMIAGEFLPAATSVETRVVLTDEQRALKQRMLACFVSQREMLRRFPLTAERFRRAPRYDFTRPPHAGALLYESFGWEINGAIWREQARAALAALGLIEI